MKGSPGRWTTWAMPRSRQVRSIGRSSRLSQASWKAAFPRRAAGCFRSLRMFWLSSAPSERAPVVPEAEGLEPGIDQPFGLGAGLRVGRRAAAPVLDLAVVTEDAAVRSDFFNLALADADVRESHSAGERRLDRLGRLLDD